MGRIAESNLIRIVEMQGAKLKTPVRALSSNLNPVTVFCV
jgi:hypothetical protein